MPNQPNYHLRALSRTLVQGLRGAAFRPMESARIDATSSLLVGLMAVAITLRFALDFYSAGLGGELAWYGLPNLLFKVPIILIGAWAFSRLSGRPEATMLLTVGITAIAIPVEIVSGTLLWALDSRTARQLLRTSDWYYGIYQHLAPAWLAFAAAMTTFRFLDSSAWRTAYRLLPGMLLIWLPLSQTGSYSAIWSPRFDEDAYTHKQMQRDALIREDAFYFQPRLLEKALASLERSQSDKIGLFFVGVAGSAEQDVFMKEMRYVSNFFKAHFETTGHSISLINNPKTVLETPIASVTSLRSALKQVGKVMDTDKDMLFLYLTSHGSRNHQFSLEFGSMHFDALDPITLRTILDESGIKNRVIVVSACYSGGFVKPLQNANTLVITASAPDKQSHGCSNDADFTFFGKAYFEDGLRKTDSFIKAFDIAKPLIAEREMKDDFEPAQPQMFVGAEIGKVIDQFVAERNSARLATHGQESRSSSNASDHIS